MNEEIAQSLENRYMKEVKKTLPLKTNDRKKVLSTIKRSVCDYIFDHEVTDYQTLLRDFGAPRETVDNYINESPGYVHAQANRTILLILIISILLVCSIAYFCYIRTPAIIIEEAPVEIETFPDHLNSD